MHQNIDIQLSDTSLDTSECLSFVESNSSGSTNLFVGRVRDSTNGQRVIRLEFEAYEPMAVSELNKIASDILLKWPVERVSIHHRTGSLVPGEIAVIIAIGSPHRNEGFASCQYAIDTLKETVPIWKKEVFENGETWVSAHPLYFTACSIKIHRILPEY